MHWAIILFIGLSVGAILGFALAAILTVGSNYEKMQETYNYGFEAGFEAGKKSVLEAKDVGIEN